MPASCYTLYLFKQLLYAYQQGTGQDLVYETFASLTQGQAQHFGVVGDRIPMDSKLIGIGLQKKNLKNR